MTCPQCSSDKMLPRDFEDFDRSAGYLVIATEYYCIACGAVSTEQEMDAANKEAE